MPQLLLVIFFLSLIKCVSYKNPILANQVIEISEAFDKLMEKIGSNIRSIVKGDKVFDHIVKEWKSERSSVPRLKKLNMDILAGQDLGCGPKFFHSEFASFASKWLRQRFNFFTFTVTIVKTSDTPTLVENINCLLKNAINRLKPTEKQIAHSSDSAYPINRTYYECKSNNSGYSVVSKDGLLIFIAFTYNKEIKPPQCQTMRKLKCKRQHAPLKASETGVVCNVFNAEYCENSWGGHQYQMLQCPNNNILFITCP